MPPIKLGLQDSLTAPYIRRTIAYPAVDVGYAQLGYNMQSTFGNSAAIDLAVSGGATLLRTQPGWSSVESFSSNTMSLGSSTNNALQYIADNYPNVQPMFVAGYGPPFVQAATLTVGSNTSIGSSTIPISNIVWSNGLSSFQWPLSFASGPGGSQLNGHWSYYGVLIDSWAGDNSTITLAAPLTTNLTAGQTFAVYQLKYNPIVWDGDPANQHYADYVKFMADQIASYGLTGYVEVWNEYVWGNDRWDSLAAFYASPPSLSSLYNRLTGLTWNSGIVFNGDMRAIQVACNQLSLPAGVKLINGVSDKTGFAGVLHQGVVSVGSTINNTNFQWDGIHPYGNAPEDKSWNYMSQNPGNWWEAVNGWVNGTGNFRNMAAEHDLLNSGFPGTMASETGAQLNNVPERFATYLTRTVSFYWGLRTPSVIYALSEGTGNTFNTAEGLVPNQGFTALQRLMDLAGQTGATGGDLDIIPDVVGWQQQTGCAPLMSVPVVGQDGVLLIIWQQTYSAVGASWPNLTPPPPVKATVWAPPVFSLASVTNLSDGTTQSVSLDSKRTVSVTVTDSPVALLFTS